MCKHSLNVSFLILLFFVKKDGVSIDIHKVFGAQMLLERTTTGFIDGTAAQVLVAIRAVRQVFF